MVMILRSSSLTNINDLSSPGRGPERAIILPLALFDIGIGAGTGVGVGVHILSLLIAHIFQTLSYMVWLDIDPKNYSVLHPPPPNYFKINVMTLVRPHNFQTIKWILLKFSVPLGLGPKFYPWLRYKNGWRLACKIYRLYIKKLP